MNRGMFTEKYIKFLTGLVLVFVVIALGAYAKLTFIESTNISGEQATISVSGDGEVFAKPDIAIFSFSVRAEGVDAGSAQEKSAKSINKILNYLEDENISEKDIKTQYYNLNPQYEYVNSVCTREGFCPPGKRVLSGYVVNQTIQIKVRDIDTAGSLISGVGSYGATDVSGLQFTIDDEDIFTEEARAQAIDEAKQKAKQLAKDLGVSLVRIIGFNENGGNYNQKVYRTESLSFDTAADGGFAPNIPTGENVFNSSVTITYEVK